MKKQFCLRGHNTFITGRNAYNCKVCVSMYQKQYRFRHVEKLKQYNKEKYIKNREILREQMRQWNKKHSAENVARAKAWALANPERNQALSNKKAAARRQCNVSFGQEGITEFYMNRPLGYHVDHIIPLRGKLVSGLHVIWNLQYLPATLNLKKHNIFPYALEVH